MILSCYLGWFFKEGFIFEPWSFSPIAVPVYEQYSYFFYQNLKTYSISLNFDVYLDFMKDNPTESDNPEDADTHKETSCDKGIQAEGNLDDSDE